MDIGFVNSFFFQVSEIAIFNLHIQKKVFAFTIFILFLTLYWVFEIGIIIKFPFLSFTLQTFVLPETIR